MVECTPDKRKVGRSIRPRPRMPQFDVSSFFNQIIWLTLFFSSFYFVVLGYLLPEIVSGLKARYKKEKNELSLPSHSFSSVNETTLLINVKKKSIVSKILFGFNSAL